MPAAQRRRRNTVRIVGGEWRGRRLRFPNVAGLRPSSDRTRETLFNWLSTNLPGARCLDLFAGSGALGFEAASRGAVRVVMVEAAREVLAALEVSRRELGAHNHVELVHAPATHYLGRPAEPFDVVFVDPPFAEPELASTVCQQLSSGWLTPASRVYLEISVHAGKVSTPPQWRMYRELRSGDARAVLYATVGYDADL